TVFLHFACAGPKTLQRTAAGKFDTASRQLDDNAASWLGFADLVFIDPVGTGFSHLIKPKPKEDDGKKSAESEEDKNPYWATKKDLDSIGQFMRRFLRQHKLWRRPLYYAGESYGGYRACRLAKLLNKEYGLGMAGIISISPIWQFRDAAGSDYSTAEWINILPSYAAIAHHHGINRCFPRKSHAEITDLYDGSLYSLDPFPHRTNNETAVHESLFQDEHLFQNAVHQWYFETLGVETPLEYVLLSEEAFKGWKNDEKKFDLFETASAVDDFRAGMTANPQQRAMIVHGRFDTVTPYFASKRILHQANLDESVKARIEEKLYDGGHMFYSWPNVNARFAEDVRTFVSGAETKS
ncbi:MAG: hypothetical protein P8Z69_03600, partial [Acidihalobacter sp.]